MSGDGLDEAGLEGPGWRHFNAEWYLVAYPEVQGELEQTDFSVVRRHYVEQGRQRGYSPNMYFDEAWYLRRYPDVGDAVAEGRVESGYAHYCAQPDAGRAPHWLFDEQTYAGFSTDLSAEVLAAARCVNLYDHFVRAGSREGRIAHLLFDPATYRSWVAAGGVDIRDVDAVGAFAHFLNRVWTRRRDAVTSVYFDPIWYVATYPEAGAAIEAGVFACALHAYLVGLPPPLTNPCAEFDEAFYLAQNPGAVTAIQAGELLSGYEHFLKFGVFDLAAPGPGIDLAAYRESRRDVPAAIRAGEVRDVYEHFLRHGWTAPLSLPVAAVVVPLPQRGRGHVEFFGHHMPSRGWIFCGWVTTDQAVLDAVVAVTAFFERGQLSGDAMMASHVREDLGGLGLGVVLHLEASGAPLGALISVSIAMPGSAWTVMPSQHAPVLRDQALAGAVLPVIAALVAGDTRTRLHALASRRGFTGANTLGELRDRVFLEIDEAIFCPPNGLVLVGWALFDPSLMRAVRVQCGHLASELRLDRCVRLDRHDVLESVGLPNGLQELRSGFAAYLPDALLPDEPAYFEIETGRGEVAHRNLPKAKLRGMQAIRFLLDRADVRYGEVAPAFDHVFGPAVTALNLDRLHTPPNFDVIEFGPQPAAPVLTVIVTLYGRLDFMEYQFGFMSRRVPDIEVEYIYVLDDPSRQRDAEALAASIHQRFQIPLKLVGLSRNLGFGPANNIGLGLARGEFVCFLNSDVFAGSPDWMERLVARLRADAWLGAVGPLLLFEDDCVQHQGMVFERLPEFASWRFPMHVRKGWRRPAETGLQSCLAITGACMVMRTDIAVQLGGFDEAYVIGDFEDSDLCLKLRRRGLSCAVDMDVFLYHLERQSQAGSEQRWRMNLTLCNAWTHERRWGDTLARIERNQAAPQVADAAEVLA